MLTKVKTYTFDRLKKGFEVVGYSSSRIEEELTVNPNYIVLISKLETPEFVLFKVELDKTATNSPITYFYTDYEGYKLLTKKVDTI